MPRRVQIAVIGAGDCRAELRRVAEEAGERIARAGAVLVCGGLAGVMGAAATGARQAGGLSVGILPSYDAHTAHPCVDVVIPTGLGHARNVLVVAAADAVLALSGEHGTASEIALALTLGRPVIAVDAWRDVAGVTVVDDVAQAVRAALSAGSRRRPSERRKPRRGQALRPSAEPDVDKR